MNGPELRDIHLPADSLWWPPAPGWWLLPVLVLLLVAALLWLRSRRRHPSFDRLSILELRQIRREYDAGRADSGAVINAVASLLRRVLIGYRGRTVAAASTGGAWLGQLEQLVSRPAFSDQQLQLLARGRYRAETDCDVESLLQACEVWIRSLPRGRRHAAD
ncbi:MAG TPA: DUF4381 domain-containing protein [Gammaproteobacteria bacterium]|nr:DUF4381 domain-containing protein [Gammaproteobacteria bacterium]